MTKDSSELLGKASKIIAIEYDIVNRKKILKEIDKYIEKAEKYRDKTLDTNKQSMLIRITRLKNKMESTTARRRTWVYEIGQLERMYSYAQKMKFLPSSYSRWLEVWENSIRLTKTTGKSKREYKGQTD